jgi:N4-gp56 family major capsid protein
MADALTGLTEVTPTIEQLISAQVQEVLTANVVMPPLVWDWSAQAGPGIDRIKIPRLSNFTVNTKAENVAVDAQVNAFSTDDLLLNQHKVVQVLVEDIAELQSKVAVTRAYVDQMAKDLAADMDLFVLNELEAGVSTAAPDHKRAYAGASLAKADILLARQLLNEAKVPMSDRSCVVSPASEASLLSISEFVRVDESGGSEALRNGRIGKLFGFDVYVSSQAEDLKSMFFHKTAQAFARQMEPRVLQFQDVPNLAVRWSLDQIHGAKTLDSGKRQVLLGTA